jgi:hypothetical protein
MKTPNSEAEVASHDLFSAVYSVLVEKAGAIESYRRDFIYHHTEADHPCDEWRFQGKLGVGGKYWRRDNRVSCYSEDSTPEREAIIAETNAALSSQNTLASLPNNEKRS